MAKKIEDAIRECVRTLREATVGDVEAAAYAVGDYLVTGDKSDDLVIDSILDGIRWGHRASVTVDLAGGCMVRARLPGGVGITHEWEKEVPLGQMAKALLGDRAAEAIDEIERLRGENARLLRLMAKAHAVMRQTGWQLAPESAGPASDGVLELAAAEVESEFASAFKGMKK